MLLILLLHTIISFKGLAGGAEPETLCTAYACFTVHADWVNFEEARLNCFDKGGYLMTVRDAEEEDVVLSLLSKIHRRNQDRILRFWIGLKLHKGDCVLPDQSLKGFKWVSGEEDSHYSKWEQEPVNTCTEERCVRIHYLASGQNQLRWTAKSCKEPAFYMCKFYFKGMCKALMLLGPGNITYMAPFSSELRQSDTQSLPLGTSAEITCGSHKAHYSVCTGADGAFHWTLRGPFCKAGRPTCAFNNGGCEHFCSQASDEVRCFCKDGYELEEDGFFCRMKAVCGINTCEHQCIMGASGYSCKCPDGLKLDANLHSCSDIDECQFQPCGDQLCINTHGSYTCVCKEGFKMVAGRCRDVDECAQPRCKHTCLNFLGSFSCHCNTGFALSEDGHSCIDVDECVRNRCEFKCVNTLGSFLCTCPQSFQLDTNGMTCSPAVTTTAAIPLNDHTTENRKQESVTRTTTEVQHHLPQTGAPPAFVANITQQSNISMASSLADIFNSRVMICVLGSVIPLILVIGMTLIIAVYRCNHAEEAKEAKKSDTTDEYCWVSSGLDPRLEKLYNSILTDDLLNMTSLNLNAQLTQLHVLMLCCLLAALKQAEACEPVCINSDCVTVNQDRMDFSMAEEACRARNGELMVLQSEKDQKILEAIGQSVPGHVWIGLRLPAGICSNLSVPLRGYAWRSHHVHRGFIPSFVTWKDSTQVCSVHCVSLSNDLKWTERLCSDKIDGFLCTTDHKNACQAQEAADANTFQSANSCSDAPCEHICTDVPGSYKCSCFQGYIPKIEDPHQCQVHCTEETCPAICANLHAGTSCICPEGFIMNKTFCVDIDECEMEQCDQKCKNTYGSFVCACWEGFKLKDHIKCIRAEEDIVIPTDPVQQPSNHTVKMSPAAGHFLWVWILVAVGVVVVIFGVRFYVIKRQEFRERNPQRTTPHEDEC
ncbi:complement component C1q receptor [Thalassophryne amazonica]|uniref:complement component C1q receptor n=1 Tax=Thalassophryne amazonica TaxID=390379 RepID=UPI0014725D5C|nr:complement component C1q receptor [Thalassophryne amazonica]